MKSSGHENQSEGQDTSRPAVEQEPTPEEAAVLELLRKRVDQQLACLNAPGAEERFESIMRHPTKLNVQIMAGKDY